MKPNRRHWITATVLALSMATTAFAAERATKEEARALNDAAIAHIKKVGMEQAVKDFGADKARWMPKDLYPFVMDFGGIMRFHISDKLMGRNALDVKDAAGKEFGREMVGVAKTKGTGWIDYEWAHPATKKVEDKTAFIQRVPGADAFVGVGVYR